jgi:hypothetical protein
MDHLFPIHVWSAEAVASAGAVESVPIDIDRIERIESLRLRAASVSGAADVKLEFARGHLPIESTPAAEIGRDEARRAVFGAYEELFASSATEFSAAPENWQSYDMVAPLSRFVKFRVTGVGANPADTLFDLKLICRGC